MDKMFPPLPRSDTEAMARNSYDAQFQKGSKDFWRGNYLEKVELKETPSCEHFFVQTSIGVECRKCRIGWIGKTFSVKNGKLYFKNQEIKF